MARFWRKKNVDRAAEVIQDSDDVSENEAKTSFDFPTEQIAYGRLWKVGLAAALLPAALNTMIYGLAVGLGIPMAWPRTAGSTEMESVSVFDVIVASTWPAVGATVLLAFFGIPFLSRRLPRSTRILWGVAFFVLLFSLVGPLTLPADDLTKYVLSLMHAVAAVMIVGVLTLFGPRK